VGPDTLVPKGVVTQEDGGVGCVYGQKPAEKGLYLNRERVPGIEKREKQSCTLGVRVLLIGGLQKTAPGQENKSKQQAEP